MDPQGVIVKTDLVDIGRHPPQAGGGPWRAAVQAHDDGVRGLARSHRGLEIGRPEGFLLAFDDAAAALGFVRDYRALLASLRPVPRARVGVHRGGLTLRTNTDADRALGAAVHEADGLAVSTVARLAALALPGQVLACDAVRHAAGEAPGPSGGAWQALGHWHLKGLPDPLALHEWAETPSAWRGPPPEQAKAQPVVPHGDGWRPAREVPCQLPAELDSFVGRAGLRADLADRLAGGHRLLTLQGPGGAGKTRLALRVARDALAGFPGGAWFCDLSRASGPDAVRQALAQGLAAHGPVSDDATLVDAIRSRGRCLLVLDNVEQVLGPVRASVPRWLAAAPQAVLLVTSRERLALAGEAVVTVGPLAPDEAIELFRRRMAAVRGLSQPHPELDDAALPDLVALLDHLPLALELAAARTRLLTPLGLLQRMGDRFRLLARQGDADDRHATMQATLTWSWALLTASEASALAQLSVFDGSFGGPEAAAVVRLPDADTRLLDVLQSLQDKSLLQRGADGRYSMLMTVRQFAARQHGGPGDAAASRPSLQRRPSSGAGGP